MMTMLRVFSMVLGAAFVGAALQGCALAVGAAAGGAAGYAANENGYEVQSPVKKDRAGGYKVQPPVTHDPEDKNSQ